MNQITFWSKYDKEETLEEWRSKEISLTALHALTLESHKAVGQNVILYSYQKIADNLPENVETRDADELYSASLAFQALKRGHSIAHVSDLVRLLEAAKSTGVVIDLDAVMLRPFPDKGFLCSMPAKMTGAFAPQWGEAHPPLTIVDKSWDGKALSNFPVSVDEGMRHYIFNLAKMIQDSLEKKPVKGTKGWNYIMWALKAIPNEKNKYKVYPPFYTSPVPAWLQKGNCYSLEYPTRLDGKTTLFGYTLPAVSSILKASFCVLHFFESSFKGHQLTGEGFWETVHERSLLGREAEHVLGSNWRKVLLAK